MTVEIRGSESIYRVMAAVGGGAREKMLVTMKNISSEMTQYVKERKLSGDPIHRRTGQLRRSVSPHTSQSGSAVSASTGTSVKYAKYLEYGTAPHVILPVRAKMLSWMQGGRRVFARKVNHPGNPAFRPFRGALEETAPKNVESIRLAMVAMIREAQS